MAADDDLDDLEAQLEDYNDDEDDDDLPPLKRLWKKHKLLILPLASLPIFGFAIWASTGDSTIGDRKVVVIPELAKQPGQPIKLQPEGEEGGGPAGKDKEVFNVVAEGENEGKIAIVAPPEEPKEPAADAGEGEAGAIAMLPEGAEKTPTAGKDAAAAGILPPPTPPESEGEVAKELPEPGAAPAGGGKAENILPAPDASATTDTAAKEDEKPALAANEAAEKPKPDEQTAKKEPAPKENEMTVVIPKKPEAEQESQVAAVVPKATATAAKVKPSAPSSDSGTTPMRTMAGVYRVQIASARSEGAAKTLWDKQVSKYPDVLGKLPLTVQAAVVKDRGTFYRVQGGSFNDRETADSICRKLKARGQDCIVVRP